MVVMNTVSNDMRYSFSVLCIFQMIGNSVEEGICPMFANFYKLFRGALGLGEQPFASSHELEKPSARLNCLEQFQKNLFVGLATCRHANDMRTSK